MNFSLGIADPRIMKKMILKSSLIYLLLLNLSGCASSKNFLFDADYRAQNLPREYQAIPSKNVQTLDLSKLSSSPVNSNLIDLGDVIEITISAGLGQGETTTFPSRVTEAGMAQLPIIGTIPIAGLSLEEAEATIAATCEQKEYYRSPLVTVTLKRKQFNRVTVIGAVNEPGVKEIPRSSCNLLSAIVAGGGLAEDAGNNVEIRMPNKGILNANPRSSQIQRAGHSRVAQQRLPKSSIQVNLTQAIQNANQEYKIPDGAVVMVEKRDPLPVQVIGLVKKPGQYDFPVGKDLRVLDAIALAEGVSVNWASKIIVIRSIEGRNEPVVIRCSIYHAKHNGTGNLLLKPGDIVSVEQTPATVLMDIIKVINVGVNAGLGTFF